MSRTILVVDGSNLARTVLKSYLQKELPEANVHTAADGDEAKRLLKDGAEPYALVTTALLLPDMDGIDLCRVVRSSNRHRYAPVVVVSSDADERLNRGGFEAGVTEYFDKSRGLEALGAFMKEFTQRSPGYVGRILYVEDSRTAAMWGRNAMERHGLQVVHVASAEAAMQYLAGGDELPDVVVTDYFLSGQATGEDLLRYIRLDQRRSPQELPVLVVTGTSGNDRHAEVLHRGANDFIEKPIVEEILIARIRSLLLVKQTFAALQQQSEAMRRMALTDSLTGTRNKRYLLEFGEAFIAGGQGPAAVLITDIDHFKRINDVHGHLTGDKILVATGRLLNELFPDSAGHVVARFGGEEFVILLRDTGRQAALAAAEHFRAAMEGLQPEGIDLTVCVGVADTERFPNTDLSRLIAFADEALYLGKANGRNQVRSAGAGEMEQA